MKEKLIAVWENERLQSFIRENRDMIIKVAAAALLVVAAFFVFLAGNNNEDVSLSEEKNVIMETEKNMILVDIGGEVNKPMVAELEEGSRVEDAIIAAGGVTDDADLTDINRAAFVEDGEKIFIPSKTAEVGENTIASNGTAYSYDTDDRVNINTADSQQLQQLNGIGPVTAEKIIDYREEHGRFKNIEDIKNVSGIGDKTFEKFKDDIKI